MSNLMGNIYKNISERLFYVFWANKYLTHGLQCSGRMKLPPAILKRDGKPYPRRMWYNQTRGD
jgi:hypothetical protein